MAWAYQSTSAKVSGTTTVTVSYPAGTIAGDTLILHCARAFQNSITFTAPGFTALTSRGTHGSVAMLYRVADGTEGASVVVTGAGNISCSMSRFTGGPTAANFATSIIGTSSTGTSDVNLTWPSLTIVPNNNCLVLTGGVKQVNLTSFNVPSPWTAEINHSLTSEGGQAFVWDYLIQTTATDITAGSWTITPTTSGPRSAIIAAITAPPAGGGGTGTTNFPPIKRKTYVFYDTYYPR